MIYLPYFRRFAVNEDVSASITSNLSDTSTLNSPDDMSTGITDCVKDIFDQTNIMQALKELVVPVMLYNSPVCTQIEMDRYSPKSSDENKSKKDYLAIFQLFISLLHKNKLKILLCLLLNPVMSLSRVQSIHFS